MAYRDLHTALSRRRDALQNERAELDRQLSNLERMRDEREKLDAELDDLTAKLNEVGKHRLPLLARLQVATPCHAKWEEMAGDDRVRFCNGCKKSVYDLSALSDDEAEALIYEKEGTLCARFFRREDGSILTSDCKVGTRRRRRRVAIAAAGLAATALGAYIGFGSPPTRTMGAIAVVQPPTPPFTGSVSAPVKQPPERH